MPRERVVDGENGDPGSQRVKELVDWENVLRAHEGQILVARAETRTERGGRVTSEPPSRCNGTPSVPEQARGTLTFKQRRVYAHI